MSIVAYYPYRCSTCSYRFPSFRYRVSEAAAPPIRGAERQIATTRGALQWKQRRREIVLYSTALTLFGLVLYFLTREPSIGN